MLGRLLWKPTPERGRLQAARGVKNVVPDTLHSPTNNEWVSGKFSGRKDNRLMTVIALQRDRGQSQADRKKRFTR